MTWTIAWTALCAAGIPTSIVGVLTWYLKKKIEHQELKDEEREQARIKNQMMIIRLTMASLSLGEATAEAVQRIPDAHCNGDMAEALDFAKKAKSDYRDFEHEQTAKAVNA